MRLLATAAVVLGLLLSGSLVADDGTGHETKPPPDRALVYFLNEGPQKGKHLVFIDTQAAGYVIDQSYFAITLEPGSYLIWGSPTLAQWFEFKAGRSYVLTLDQAYTTQVAPVMGGGAGFGSTFEDGPTYSAPASWRADDPELALDKIFGLELKPLRFDEADRARLNKKFSKRKYKRAQQEAGTTYPIKLPDSFDDVGVRHKRNSLMPRSLQNVKKTGRLSIDETTLRFVLGRETLEIPLEDIRGVHGSRDEHRMRLEVLYGPPGDPDEVFFITHSHAEHNRIVMSLFEALEALGTKPVEAR